MNNLYEEVQIILHGIWRRRWVALGVAWGVALLGWLVVSLIPNVYESRARVFVQMQSVLPGNAAGSPADEQKAIDQLRQTMASAANLEKVVRSTDLALTAKTDADIAAKVGALRESVKVVSQQDNLFEVTATSGDTSLSGAQNARVAAQIVGALIQAFQETSIAGGLNQTGQSLKFLDQQIEARAKDLQAAEQKRVAFEQKNMGLLPGVGSIASRMDALRAEMTQLEPQLVAAQSALAGINGQLAGTPATIDTPGIGGGGGGALAQAQGELASARARGWTDDHPDVVALKRQIAALKSMGVGSSAGTRTPNPAYMSIRSMQAERSAAASALQGRKAQIQGALNAMAARQVQDPGLAAEQDRLNRDYDVLKQQYDKLISDREDVRLRGDAQSEGGDVQFRVIDPPYISSIPASPNRPLLLLGVLVAAVVAGLGAAFALGQIRTTYATASRLERATGMPVIGAISEIATPAMLTLGRQRTRWFAMASGGLVGLCVVLLAVEFIQRGMSA